MSRTALLVLALLIGCNDADAEHDHPHEVHHQPGEEEAPSIAVTRWTDTLELFAEHPPAVAGQPLPFLAHITVLDGYRALEGARVRLVLEGPATVSGEAGMLRAGIYRPEVTPEAAGTYRARLEIVGDGSVGGFEVIVHRDEASARAAAEEQPRDAITFLKEQQWRVPFETAFAARGTVRPTVEVAGELTTPPGGSAHVHAPVAGRVTAGRNGFPSAGQRVEAGRELASLAPTPGAPERAAQAEADVIDAEASVEAARAELARAERLLADQAVPARRVVEAERRVRVAEAGIAAARRARTLYTAASSGQGRGTWRITAPITGVVDRVAVSPGEAVEIDEPLFTIIDPAERWLSARVPEAWASRIEPEQGVMFHLIGEDEWRPVDGALLDVGRGVDPRSRTVSVTWSLVEIEPALRVGAGARVAVPAGEGVEGVVVPASAIVDVEGREVVYVQIEGETFEERAVRVGPSDGARVAILEGIEAGERVVTRGGYLVRLASRGGESVGAGHVH